MKRVVRTLVIILAALMLIAIILPFAFKGKLIGMVKDTMNENLNATVDFSGVKLNIFRNFPNLSLSIQDLTIQNHYPFEGDTLASIKSVRISLDLMKLFAGAPYEIRRLDLIAPDIRVKVLKDGTANWDIMKEEEELPDESVESSEGGFTLKMKYLQITNGSVIYDDQEIDVYVSAKGITHHLKGDLSLEKTTLATQTIADELSVVYEGILYLSKTRARVITDIQANLQDYHFAFSEGEIFINALKVLASGWFAMPEEGYRMDIDFVAPGSDFREVLSLIPAIYAKDFEKVKTSGSFALSGNVRGLYSETSMPGFSVQLNVKDAQFQYPDLPSRVDDIQLTCLIQNPDGSPDNTVIDLSRFHMVMAGTPIDASLYLRTPVSDPDLRASLNGKLDLSNVGAFYPLDGTELSGQIAVDVKMEGRMSVLDQKAYEKFLATGIVAVTNLRYAAADVPELKIPSLRMLLSPASIKMEELRVSSGTSSLQARGELTQYLGWFLRGETLRGMLNLISPRLDLNELLGESKAETPEVTEDTPLALTAPQIPANIDFTLNTQANEVLFGDLILEAVRGRIVIRDSRLHLQDLSMRTFDGEIKADGYYTHSSDVSPYLNMSLSLNGIDIGKVYEASGLMRKLAPVARHTRGKFTTSLSLSGDLDNNLNPKYPSLSGQGSLATTSIIVAGLPVMQKIADAISVDALRESVLQPLQASFAFTDGKVEVKPFSIKMKDISAEVSGSTGFDQTLAYVMKMKIPRSAMGSQANALISGWVAQAAAKGVRIDPGAVLQLDVLIGGTIMNPEVRTGLSGMADNLKEELKQAVIDKVEEIKTEVKQEVSKKAEELIKEAERQAAALMDQARKQADAIRAGGAEAAKKVRQEADIQANKIIAEGRSKGPVAAALAEKAAEKTKKEAYDKASLLEREANQKADAVTQEAQRQSDQIIEDARKKAQAI